MPAFTLTPAAVEQAKRLREENHEHHGKSLRLYIEGKGCDGFFYGVTFDHKEQSDRHFLIDTLSCIIDAQTLEYCEGSVIDWISDERGTGFLVENPSQRKYRGKFFKRKVFRDKLETSGKTESTRP